VSGEGEKLAICLHPWSRLGGSMNDPCVSRMTIFESKRSDGSDRVLHMLTETLERLHYHVLRYNCRGVGRSTGWASLTGLAEGKDLEEVIAWALETIPDVRSVVIIVRNVFLEST
jgi:alpha/beta superfamily hydrolase